MNCKKLLNIVLMFIIVLFLFINCGPTSSAIYYYSQDQDAFIDSGRTVSDIIKNAQKCSEYAAYNKNSRTLIVGSLEKRNVFGFGSPGQFKIQFVKYKGLKGLLVRQITFQASPTALTIVLDESAEKLLYVPHSKIELIYNDFYTNMITDILTRDNSVVYSTAFCGGATTDPIIYDDPNIIRPGNNPSFQDKVIGKMENPNGGKRSQSAMERVRKAQEEDLRKAREAEQQGR